MLGAGALNAGAWDYEGHHAINELALASLPADFGGFTLTPALKTRIAFLAGEPDRWRNVGDLPLKHFNGPDHYIDLEDLKLYGLTPGTLPLMRYDFVADIARERTAHPEKFPPIDPAQDADHTRELSGFLPCRRWGVALPGQLQFLATPSPRRFPRRWGAPAAGGRPPISVDIAPLLEAAQLLYGGPWIAER